MTQKDRWWTVFMAVLSQVTDSIPEDATEHAANTADLAVKEFNRRYKEFTQ